MTNRGSSELQAYRVELKNIINDLRNIEASVRYEYKNVGNERCADSIKSVINKYESALKTLNSIDASILDQLKETADSMTV